MIQSIIRRRSMSLSDEIIARAEDCGFNYIVLKRSYESGYIKSPEVLRKSEAENILIVNSNDYSESNHMRNISKDLSWVQFLKNAKFEETYLYLGYEGCFIILPPSCANNGICLRRIKNKIVIPVREPFPMFNDNSSSTTSPYEKPSSYWYELLGSTIYVPDDAYSNWLPYIQYSLNCPSWMQNSGITCARISELPPEQLAKIKVSY